MKHKEVKQKTHRVHGNGIFTYLQYIRLIFTWQMLVISYVRINIPHMDPMGCDMNR